MHDARFYPLLFPPCWAQSEELNFYLMQFCSRVVEIRTGNLDFYDNMAKILFFNLNGRKIRTNQKFISSDLDWQCGEGNLNQSFLRKIFEKKTLQNIYVIFISFWSKVIYLSAFGRFCFVSGFVWVALVYFFYISKREPLVGETQIKICCG